VAASKQQADLLRSQYLRALKMVLQCPITTPSAAVMYELGMPTLQHRWDLSKLRLQQKLQHMPVGHDPKAVFETCWGGRGAHMWADKLANIWKQMIPDRDARAQEQTRLAGLDSKHFDIEVRKLVAERGALSWERGMRCKSKLTRYAAVCSLEHQGHLQAGPQLELKSYLAGCLTPAKRLKFKLRAGVAEVQQEQERRARHQHLSESQAAELSQCPFCPGVAESVTHFLVECSAYQHLRFALWAELEGLIPVTAVVLYGLMPEVLAAHMLADNTGDAEVIGQPGRGGAVREVLEAYMLSLWQHRERCLAA